MKTIDEGQHIMNRFTNILLSGINCEPTFILQALQA